MLPGGVSKKTTYKIKNLQWYKHPHDIQKPILIEFEKLNKKIS